MNAMEGICFGCDSVSSLDRSASRARCSCGGNILPVLNLEAFKAARLAHRLGGGYFVHSSIVEFAGRADPTPPIDWQNIRTVARKDGTVHTFAFDHYFREATTNTQTNDDLDRVWITGALLRLADALGAKKYFDHAPVLELVRHLRNGIAHGNRFRIDRPDDLVDRPANNFKAAVRSPKGVLFEVTRSLQEAPVLFDFMGPGDFVDLFFSVEVHLFSIAVKT